MEKYSSGRRGSPAKGVDRGNSVRGSKSLLLRQFFFISGENMIPKFINNNYKQLVLFDMDGVLAEYVAGEEINIKNEVPNTYLNKRPIKIVIEVAKKLHDMPNMSVGILSSCEYTSQVSEKKKWLKKHLPFVEDNKVFIIVWANESYSAETRCQAKLEQIKKLSGNDEIFLIEDDHKNITATNQAIPNCAHHLSELLD